MGINMLKLLCCVFFWSFTLLATLSSCTGAGSVVEVGRLKSYVSGSPHSKHAVILASDVYGYEVQNLRTIADKVAAAGFYVVVPDFLRGDPYDPKNSTRTFEGWLNSHSPAKAAGDAKPVIAALRRRGVRAIGFAGICWGGKLAVQLAKTHRIQAAVLLHPSFVIADDFKAVKVPMAILGAELDAALPASLLKQFKQNLSSKAKLVDNLVKIFPGVPHGFTLRYDPKDGKAAKVADEAHQDMIYWFKKYVKLNKKRI